MQFIHPCTEKVKSSLLISGKLLFYWLLGVKDDKYDPLAGISEERKVAAILFNDYLTRNRA